MTEDELSSSILMARQPIFDNDLNVYAYELLFRENLQNKSGVTEDNGDLATTKVISHTFLEFGIERVIGQHYGFINLTRSFLVGDIPLPFDNHQVVLEILEDIVIDQEIITAVKDLAKQGYIIALDDFIFKEEFRPLLDVASIIKIDLLALSDQELVEHVDLLKAYDVKLLAEKVETHQQFEQCRALGFDYYQGYFFCQPTIIDDKPLPDNKLAVMRVLAGLQQSDITIENLEHLVSQDTSLSYKLLRLLNSAAVALPKQVTSLHQGLIFLGLKKIRAWATIIAFAGVKSTNNELMSTTLIRAKMAEQLAPIFDCDPDSAFMVGLFSSLDIMMTKPMASLLESLPLDPAIKEALINHDGALGKLLLFVISYQQNNLAILPPNVSIGILNNAFTTATEWTIATEAAL